LKLKIILAIPIGTIDIKNPMPTQNNQTINPPNKGTQNNTSYAQAKPPLNPMIFPLFFLKG